MTMRSYTPGPTPEFDAGREVHVHTLATPAESPSELLARYAAWLAPEELERFHRLKLEGPRRDFLLGKAMLRTTLAPYLASAASGPIDPFAIRFGARAENKPTLLAPSNAGALALEFNLTHTRGLLACAVARGLELGIDAEWIEPGRRETHIARRYFSGRELGFLDSLPPAEYDRAFFRIWTLKEALLKARGSGLRTPLRDFAMSYVSTPDGASDAGTVSEIGVGFAPGFGEDPARWQFWLAEPGPEHVLALAIAGPVQIAAVRVRCAAVVLPPAPALPPQRNEK